MDSLTLGETKITWLNGGLTKMDGGAMFGPVPKPLWSKRYPCNEKNQIELVTEPMLVEKSDQLFLIDAGIGNGRLSDKQKLIFGASEESSIEEDLKDLTIKPENIDFVLMTHLHFDHVTGLVKEENGQLSSLYPNAQIIVENREWDAIRRPAKRTQGTYWEENWRAIESQVVLFDDYYQAAPGVEMYHTGGHSPGLCVVKIEDGDQIAVHMSDIFPTHAHLNSLWVTAFDDYPLHSIEAKDQWITRGIEQNWVFLFYHDAYFRALRFDKDSRKIKWSLKRSKRPAVPFNIKD